MPEHRVVTRVNWMRSGEPEGDMMATYVPFSPLGFEETHALFTETLMSMGLHHIVRVPIGGDSIIGTAQRILDVDIVQGRWSLYYEGPSCDCDDECLVVGFESPQDAVLVHLALI